MTSTLLPTRPTDPLRSWSARRWITAALAAAGTALVLGIPTDVIPNPVFGRPVAVTWWSYPTLLVTAVLGGLLVATYVRDGEPIDVGADPDARRGGIGAALSFFAIGCPVCNKLVVLALGTTGATSWFAPLQPLLAVGSAVVLGVALRARLRAAAACPASPS